MPTGPTMSRTEAAAKPRSANARAAASSRCGSRLVARRTGLRSAAGGEAKAVAIAALDRQTLVWSSRQRDRHRGGDAREVVGRDLDETASEDRAPARLAARQRERLEQRPDRRFLGAAAKAHVAPRRHEALAHVDRVRLAGLHLADRGE